MILLTTFSSDVFRFVTFWPVLYSLRSFTATFVAPQCSRLIIRKIETSLVKSGKEMMRNRAAVQPWRVSPSRVDGHEHLLSSSLRILSKRRWQTISLGCRPPALHTWGFAFLTIPLQPSESRLVLAFEHSIFFKTKFVCCENQRAAIVLSETTISHAVQAQFNSGTI